MTGRKVARGRRLVAALLVPVLLVAAGCTDDIGLPPVASPEPPTALPVHEQGNQSPNTNEPECDPRKSLKPSPERPRKYVEQGYLRAGVDQTMGRMTYRDPVNGGFKGFDIELLEEIAKELFPGKDPKDTLRYVVLISGERQSRLNDQPPTVDIIADSMTATCKRATEVAFSTDYLDSGQTVLVLTSSPYRSISDLGGKPVCAAAGTTSIGYLLKRPEKVIPVGRPNWTDCLVMLQQGQVEAISTDHNVLLGLHDLASGRIPTPNLDRLRAEEPALNLIPTLHLSTRIVDQPPREDWQPDVSCAWNTGPCTWFSDEPHAIAFRKEDTELIRFVNWVLEKLRRNGRWREMHDRWLPDHPDKGPPPARYGPNPTWPPGE